MATTIYPDQDGVVFKFATDTWANVRNATSGTLNTDATWWIFNSRITSAKSAEIIYYQDIKIFNNVADANYINLVNFSYVFSLISLILLIIFYNKLKRARKLSLI